MRPRALGLLLAAFLLTPHASRAQEAAPAADTPTVTGSIDFGVRGTTGSGDRARYERYRDLGDGLFLDTLRLAAHRQTWLFGVAGDHVGREDQRLRVDAERPGRVEASFLWDQIPMLMTRTARTFFTSSTPGVLVIDDAIQSQAQASPASLSALFVASAHDLEISSRRHIAKGGVEYLASPALTLHATAQRTRREGNLPFGGSFGHSSLVETVAPIAHSLVDVDTGAEYSRGRLLVRGGYTASLFHNDAQTLTFDSPFRLADSASVPSRGRIALAPNSSLLGVNGLASVSLPRRSRITGSMSFGSLRTSDDAVIPPHTINSLLAVIPLERSTVEGHARTSGATVSFTSRPSALVDVDVRYRFYDYDNRTPEFTITQRVAYDNAVSTLAAPKETEPYGVMRNVFDADLRLHPGAGASAGVGFSRAVEDRTHRIFQSTRENTVRASFDLPHYRVLTLRTKFERSEKRGVGDEAEITAELTAVGEQPGMRHFDIASRNRNRATVTGSVAARSNLGLSFSLAAGKDDYLQSLFGLRDNAHRVLGAGADAIVGDHVTLSAAYEFERDKALSRSRQANPGVQFTDASRNWAADGTDRMHSVVVTGSLTKLADRLDIDLMYDYNRTRALYQYLTGAVLDRTLPEEAIVDTTLPAPTQLPLIRSQLQRGTIDAVYTLTPRVGVGVSYWFESYRVNDFTLDAEANPDLVRSGGQAILIGYLYRPYTAHTTWARLIVHW